MRSGDSLPQRTTTKRHVPRTGKVTMKTLNKHNVRLNATGYGGPHPQKLPTSVVFSRKHAWSDELSQKGALTRVMLNETKYTSIGPADPISLTFHVLISSNSPQNQTLTNINAENVIAECNRPMRRMTYERKFGEL